MNQPRASLRSDTCPTSIGIPVRYELEQPSAFIGIRNFIKNGLKSFIFRYRFPTNLGVTNFGGNYVVKHFSPSALAFTCTSQSQVGSSQLQIMSCIFIGTVSDSHQLEGFSFILGPQTLLLSRRTIFTPPNFAPPNAFP